MARPWNTPRSIAPGGGVTSTVVDQLRYAALHLGMGDVPVLKPQTITYMQSRQAAAGSMCDHIGISWMLDGEGADRIVKHGGATNGHLSSFEMLPERGYAVTVLTNSDSGREARQTVADACRRHFLKSEAKLPAADPALAAGATQYAGIYRAVLATLRVTIGPDGRASVVDETPERQFAERRLRPLPPEPAPIAFYAPDRAVVLEGSHRGERCEFLRDAGGRSNGCAGMAASRAARASAQAHFSLRWSAAIAPPTSSPMTSPVQLMAATLSEMMPMAITASAPSVIAPAAKRLRRSQFTLRL